MSIEIINGIRRYLQVKVAEADGAQEVLNHLGSIALTDKNRCYREPQIPENLSSQLETAIQQSGSELGSLVEAIAAAKDDLHWRVDRGLYYEPGAEVGSEYTENNMHCELIGPNSADYYCEDFRLGVFLLGPRVLYRDHTHAAPEFYLTLTGPTGWRFDLGQWQDHDSGSMIWNHASQVHAIRVYDKPFLSVYSWTQDVNEKCQVVSASDWDDIQNNLRMS